MNEIPKPPDTPNDTQDALSFDAWAHPSLSERRIQPWYLYGSWSFNLKQETRWNMCFFETRNIFNWTYQRTYQRTWNKEQGTYMETWSPLQFVFYPCSLTILNSLLIHQLKGLTKVRQCLGTQTFENRPVETHQSSWNMSGWMARLAFSSLDFFIY